MNVGKIKWYESFWSVLICFILAPITSYISLFPAIIFLILRIIKEIKRIIISKKNNLPLNTNVPYEEPAEKNAEIKDSVITENDKLINENKTFKDQMKEKYPDMTDDDYNTAVNEFISNNFKISISGPTNSSYTRSTSKNEYNYIKARKLVTDFIVLDFETTGLSHTSNNIIQIGAIKYTNLELVEEYSTLVNPQEDISLKITKITGITNQDVANAPTIDMVLPQLIQFIGKNTIVAHNASFDMKFLLENIRRLDIDYHKFRVIDTLSLARKYINETPNHKLPTLKSYLSLDHLESHDALADCKVTGELYKYCYNKSLVIT